MEGFDATTRRCSRCGQPLATDVAGPACALCAQAPLLDDAPRTFVPEPPAAEARVWFAMAGRERVGPLTASELTSLRVAGALDGRSFVWRPGLEAWQLLSDVPELSAGASAAAWSPPPLPSEGDAPLSAPTTGGAAARVDAFAAAPDAPSLRGPSKGDTTNAVIAASGARRSRVPQLLLGGGAVLLVLAGALFMSLRAPPPVVTPAHVSAAPAPVDAAAVAPLDDKAVAILTGDAPAAGGVNARRRGETKNHGDDGLAGLVPEVSDGPSAAQLEASLKDRPAAARQPVASDEAVDVVRHGPDARQVARRIAQAHGAFEDCALKARRREPDLAIGKVVVSATIDPTGRVTNVAFDKPALDGSDVGRCLARVVRGLTMPPFRGESASVDIPLMIGSSDEGKHVSR